MILAIQSQTDATFRLRLAEGLETSTPRKGGGGLEFEVRSSGFGVRGSEFGVRGLACDGDGRKNPSSSRAEIRD